ncbi:MAG: hypothetical protein CL424_13945 [Acidimicrobiaceae bacterium]|nr:hypothetical protein [Acidimicrobiaceae bacterium]
MGAFTYGTDTITIGDTGNIVLERLPIQAGDCEEFRLHREVTYTTTLDDGSPFTYTVPPADDPDWVTDLASVPQLLTWLVPTSGKHLPAALVHDALVDDPNIDRYHADALFRDGMGDLEVGFIRRWLMWTAVTLETVRRGADPLTKVRTFGSLLLILALGAAATVNLATDVAVLPWMGSEDGVGGFFVETAFGLAGAVVIPIVLGVLFWAPVRTAGVIAGVSIAVLFHAMLLVAGVYGFYRLLEGTPRRLQQAVGIVLVLAATAVFTWSFLR